MRYYKIIVNGYLVAVGTGAGGTEITEQEYNDFLLLIAGKPAPPDSTHVYRITEAGEYVLVEIEPPPEPDDNDELTEDEAFDIIMGGAV